MWTLISVPQFITNYLKLSIVSCTFHFLCREEPPQPSAQGAGTSPIGHVPWRRGEKTLSTLMSQTKAGSQREGRRTQAGSTGVPSSEPPGDGSHSEVVTMLLIYSESAVTLLRLRTKQSYSHGGFSKASPGEPHGRAFRDGCSPCSVSC